MPMRSAQRLRVVGCGLRGKLLWLMSMSLGMDRKVQQQKRVMHAIAMRVVAGQAAAVAADIAQEADELGGSGQCAAAVVAPQVAVDLGHTPSRAEHADMLYHCREGVPSDASRGRVLAQEGVRLGCHHCQGVMANISQVQESSLPLESARESAARGSKFGQ